MKENERNRGEKERERERREVGDGVVVRLCCVTTEHSLPHVYGNYMIVLAELTQLVAPGKPELEERKEKL